MKGIFVSLCLLLLLKGQGQINFTVYFDFDRSGLTMNAMRQLDSFLLTKKELAKNYIIHLHGYCDAIGGEDYNNTLSMNRVLTVKEYMLNHGILDKDIRSTTGHGEKDPLNQNKTEEERQLNRRVVITVDGAVQQPGETKSLTEKITDTTTKAGTSIVLKNMNFYGGTPFLLPESFPIVEELLAVMQRNPALVIEIQGHICCIAHSGDSPYGGTGNGLSEERARSIYAELIGKGIEASRVSYKGFGHSMPIYPYPERSEDERVANRRVEIKIISR
ncbi:MAG: OmpA family protein [Chitinophagales bacterium]